MGCFKSVICGGAVIIAVAAVDPIVAKATPVAVDTITPNPGLVNETITFDASASSDSDPARVLVDYAWIFGDGSVFSSPLPETTHIYDFAGNYNTALSVFDDLGLSVPVPAPLIGSGLPAVLAIGGLLFGARLWETGKKRRSIGTRIPHAAA
jgi:hypothetical protein